MNHRLVYAYTSFTAGLSSKHVPKPVAGIKTQGIYHVLLQAFQVIVSVEHIHRRLITEMRDL